MTCGRKESLSKTDANRMAQRLIDAGQDDPHAPLHAYKCSLCHRWHVGHDKFAAAKAS